MSDLVLALPNKKIVISDLMALMIVYIAPTFSHILPIPLYLFEPMRIIIIFSLFYTSKNNALLLCITLPLFSFITTGHPFLIKSVLITLELAINVIILSFFIKKHWAFVGVFVSIIFSKLIYYLFKFYLIKNSLISGDLISTSLVYQFTTLLLIGCIFSIYALLNRKNV